jgi:hypothetical protein
MKLVSPLKDALIVEKKRPGRASNFGLGAVTLLLKKPDDNLHFLQIP